MIIKKLKRATSEPTPGGTLYNVNQAACDCRERTESMLCDILHHYEYRTCNMNGVRVLQCICETGNRRGGQLGAVNNENKV